MLRQAQHERLNLMAVYMWERLEKTISQLSTLNKIAGKLRRFVIGNAIGCEMDKQG
jgi:MraZ protein